MQLDEKKIQFTMSGIGLWEATGPNCEEVKRSILYPRSKPMGWKTQTYKFLSLCSEKHKHTSALIQVWRQFLHTFMANYSSWTIDFILLAHYRINSKYYKQVNFFKIWFKKKKKNKWTMELCMGRVGFEVFFNPTSLLGLRSLQPFVAIKTT